MGKHDVRKPPDRGESSSSMPTTCKHKRSRAQIPTHRMAASPGAARTTNLSSRHATVIDEQGTARQNGDAAAAGLSETETACSPPTAEEEPVHGSNTELHDRVYALEELVKELQKDNEKLARERDSIMLDETRIRNEIQSELVNLQATVISQIQGNEMVAIANSLAAEDLKTDREAFEVEQQEWAAQKIFYETSDAPRCEGKKYALDDTKIIQLLERKYLSGYADAAMVVELRAAFQEKYELDEQRLAHLKDHNNPRHPYQMGLRVGRELTWTVLCNSHKRQAWDDTLDTRQWSTDDYAPIREGHIGYAFYPGVLAGMITAQEAFDDRIAASNESISECEIETPGGRAGAQGNSSASASHQPRQNTQSQNSATTPQNAPRAQNMTQGQNVPHAPSGPRGHNGQRGQGVNCGQNSQRGQGANCGSGQDTGHGRGQEAGRGRERGQGQGRDAGHGHGQEADRDHVQHVLPSRRPYGAPDPPPPPQLVYDYHTGSWRLVDPSDVW